MTVIGLVESFIHIRLVQSAGRQDANLGAGGMDDRQLILRVQGRLKMFPTYCGFFLASDPCNDPLRQRD